MHARFLRVLLGGALLAALAPAAAHAETRPITRLPRDIPFPILFPFTGDPMSVVLDKTVGISVDARDQERRNLNVLDGLINDVSNYTGGLVNIDPNATASASAYARIRKFERITGGGLVVGANAAFNAQVGGLFNVGSSASARAEAGYRKAGALAICRLERPCPSTGYYGLVEVRDFAGNVQTLVRQDSPDPLTVARDFIVYMPDPRPYDQTKYNLSLAGANIDLSTYLSGWFAGDGRASINPTGGDASFHGRAHLVASALGTGTAGPATTIFGASLTALDDTINTTDGGRAFVDAKVTLGPKRKNSAWNMCATYNMGATVERAMSYLAYLNVVTPFGVQQPFKKESGGFWLPPSFSPPAAEECVPVP